MRPLRTKLLVNNVLTVVISFVIFGILLSYGIFRLSGSLNNFNRDRAQAEGGNLMSISNENVDRIQEIYKAGLESKGQKLLQKDSASLVSMIEDNAFVELRNFLEKTFRNDGELVLASYFVREKGELKAWAYLSRQYPSGLGIPIEFERKTSTWKGKGPNGQMARIQDPDILKSLNINSAKMTLKTLELADASGKISPVQAYDCIIPIYKKGSTPEQISAARKRGEPVGYLRYVLSLERMEKSIQDTKNGLQQGLKRAQAQSESYATQGKALMSSLVTNMIILMALGAALVLVLAYAFSWVSSNRVTKPVIELTHVAERMAAGEYKQEVSVESDDEVGILAQTFREMGIAITRRDEEIRLAERQLAEIFAAVPVGILAVGVGGIVEPKYSGYAEWLLGTQQVAGQELGALLFAGELQSATKEVKEALQGIPNIFGKPELHWEMTKLFLPAQIKFTLPAKSSDKERYIGLTYQPVFRDDELVRLLVVLEDRTAVVKAHLEIEEAQLHEDKSVLRLIQIKKTAPETVHKLIAEISSLMGAFRADLEARDENHVKRVLHSIKGSSRILGLSFLAELIHGIEIKNRVNETEGKTYDWAATEVGAQALAAEWNETYGLYLAVFGEATQAKLASENSPSSLVQLASLGDVIRLKSSETAKTLKKKVQLNFDVSPDLQAGQNVVQVFSEALLHLISNSIAHGIADPAEREKQGKPAQGIISVKTTAEGAKTLVCEIADDGNGINVEALKASALKKGLMTSEELGALTQQQALELIFKPGLSSKDTPDMVSGMGIGMDTVRQRVESLGGRIQVQESTTSGTRITFSMNLA